MKLATQLKRIGLRLVVLMAVLLGPTANVSGAPSGTDQLAELIRDSAGDLEAGRIEAAITRLETAADEGRHHPELSFNRGLAYLRRVGTADERPGDLGQAAAAFAETLAQRSGDVEAQRALEECQLFVARRNAQGKLASGAQVSSPLGLVERALLSFSPAALFWLGVVGSGLLSLGLLLRLRRDETQRLSGTILAGVGGLVLVPGLLLFLARAALFEDAKMAVVVARQADWVDEAGRRRAGRASLAESTVVYVRPSKGGQLRMVGAFSNEYLRAGQLRLVSYSAL